MRKLETFEAIQAFGIAEKGPSAAAIKHTEARSGAENLVRHVLFIIDSFYGTMAGSEGTLDRIVRHLPRTGFRCSVITFSSTPSEEQLPSLSCPFHVLPIRWKRPSSVLTVALQIRKIIREENVDVVHTFFEVSDILGGLVARWSGVPVLVSSRRDMGIRLRPWTARAYNMANGLFDQIQAVSEEVRAFSIRRYGISGEKIVTVENGVELERILSPKNSGAVDSLGLERASHVVACVGNVRPIKGFDVLIRAASMVYKEFPQTVFLFIGYYHKDSKYVRQLQELCRLLGVSQNVRFLGQRTDVFSLLRRCDLFCMLSRSEGMSNAILEAMAAGLAVVATKVGGNPELVEDGRTGFLVPNEDSDAAAERISELLRHPVRRRQMGAAARLKIGGRFTAEGMVNRMAVLYGELLAKKRSR